MVLGGTAGAGDDGTPPFSGLFDRGADVPPFGPELFGGWLTCSRFLRVTSSVLRLLRRCCRCTASFEDEASVKGKRGRQLRRFSTDNTLQLHSTGRGNRVCTVNGPQLTTKSLILVYPPHKPKWEYRSTGWRLEESRGEQVENSFELLSRIQLSQKSAKSPSRIVPPILPYKSTLADKRVIATVNTASQISPGASFSK